MLLGASGFVIGRSSGLLIGSPSTMGGGCFFWLTFHLPVYGGFLARVGNIIMAIAKYNLLIDDFLETIKLANVPK